MASKMIAGRWPGSSFGDEESHRNTRIEEIDLPDPYPGCVQSDDARGIITISLTDYSTDDLN